MNAAFPRVTALLRCGTDICGGGSPFVVSENSRSSGLILKGECRFYFRFCALRLASSNRLVVVPAGVGSASAAGA